MKRIPSAILGSSLLLALAAAGCVVRAAQPNYYPSAQPPPPPSYQPAPSQPYYPPPPPPMAREPEEMLLFPDIDIYLVPDISLDILFSNGRWYLSSNQSWYWGDSPRGPWSWVRPDEVPAPVRRLPPDWRTRYRWKKIPYQTWKQHDHRWDDSYLRPPPVIIDRDPDEIHLIPGRRVYILPRTDADIFFYLDRWYQRVGDHWYWSTALRGPWNYLQGAELPGAVREVPRDYRSNPRIRNLPFRPWVDKGHRWEDEDDERWEEHQRDRERDQVQKDREKDAREREKETRERDRDRDRRDDGRGGPAFRIDREPEEMWLLPGQRVYVLPRTDVDVFYFSGRWFHRDGQRWWWGGTVRGPWIALPPDQVPEVVRRQPGGARDSREYRRIPYREWERKGYRWEDDDRGQTQPPPPIQPPPPPAVRGGQYQAPAEVVYLPKLKVFALPGTGVVMSGSRWYRREAGRWQAGSGWRGPWSPVPDNQLPPTLRLIPEDPAREPGAQKMPFPDWERNGYRWPEQAPPAPPQPPRRPFS